MPLIRSMAALAVAGLAAAPTAAQDLDRHGRLAFEGRYILAVSDTDMLASAYVDGNLGPREGQDTLSVIRLGGNPRDWRAVGIKASNSVASPPAVLDVTPEGRWAFVVETWTPRPQGDGPHSFGDLRRGNRLLVFDVGNPDAPVLAQEIETFERPDAVRVSSDGSIVAVSFHPDGAGQKTPLALYPFSDGRLGEPVTPAISGWNLEQAGLVDMDWHPTERIIALLNHGEADLRFARVNDDLSLEVFGNVVEIERAPLRAEFTPDGRHVVVNANYWGPDIAGTYVEAPRGSVLTVRMNAEVDGDRIRHAVISRTETGVSPEGLAISPDGRWVVTTNLERSYLPYDDPRITWFSSLTLAKLDQETGVFTRIGEFNYDGILPEAAVFDNSGNYLAVANFDHFDDRREGSSVDFWRIQADPLDPSNIQLVKTEHSVRVPRGVHSMAIAR
jgi:DNA-binding beta-propeller fold protein YncE